MLTKVTPMAIVTPGVTVLPLFKFIADQLSDLAFYDCPEAAVVGDFAKGLRAAIAAKAAVDLDVTKIVEEPLVCSLD